MIFTHNEDKSIRIELDEADKEKMRKGDEDLEVFLDIISDKDLSFDSFWYGSAEFLFDDHSGDYYGMANQYTNPSLFLYKNNYVEMVHLGKSKWCCECGYLPDDGQQAGGDHHRDCSSYTIICEDCNKEPHTGVGNEFDCALCESCLKNRQSENKL